MDEDRCPPVLRGELAIHVSFNAAMMQHALDNWPAVHHQYRQAQKTVPYYYKESVYSGFGL